MNDLKNNDKNTIVYKILDKLKISYLAHSYLSTGAISGMEVAKALNQDPSKVFKTLVTVGKSRTFYVFLVPVNKELDLKKASQAVLEKSVEMIKAKDLFPLTGYVHGGCSPIGMKKTFKTIIDSSCLNYDTIIFSGGKIGYQVEITLEQLAKVITFTTADIV